MGKKKKKDSTPEIFNSVCQCECGSSMEKELCPDADAGMEVTAPPTWMSEEVTDSDSDSDWGEDYMEYNVDSLMNGLSATSSPKRIGTVSMVSQLEMDISSIVLAVLLGGFVGWVLDIIRDFA